MLHRLSILLVRFLPALGKDLMTRLKRLHVLKGCNWFPKIRDNFLAGPHNMDFSMLRSVLGSSHLGNYAFADVSHMFHVPS